MSQAGQRQDLPNQDVVVLLNSHSRIGCLRGNQELLRTVWRDHFPGVRIVHVTNGQRDWYPRRTLEDLLVRTGNVGSRYIASSNLLDTGMEAVSRLASMQPRPPHLPPKWVISMNADIWVADSKYMSDLIAKMRQENAFFAGTPHGMWNHNLGFVRAPTGKGGLDFNGGFSSDFFVVDFRWATKYGFLPFDATKYDKSDVGQWAYGNGDIFMLERLLGWRYRQAIIKYLDQNPGPYTNDPRDTDSYREAERRFVDIEARWFNLHRHETGQLDHPGVPPKMHKDIWPGFADTRETAEAKVEFLQQLGIQPDPKEAPTLARLLETANSTDRDFSWFEAQQRTVAHETGPDFYAPSAPILFG